MLYATPFYYGWVVVIVAFITLSVGVNSRTAFSLLFPPILDEFGWSRATIAAIFSIGFVTSTILAPLAGSMMDRYGPRFVIPLGSVITASGFILASFAVAIWHFYITLGLMVVGGSIFISYIGHTAFLPNWFSNRRGLAMGIAFSGVGVGSITLLPWYQVIIEREGWRETSTLIGIILLVILVPLNVIFQRRRPEDLGLSVDGTRSSFEGSLATNQITEESRIVDKDWYQTEWTVARALKTRRFWWLTVSCSSALYVWYAVQVHQTRFLIDVGLSANIAAVGLGLVGATGVVGQISIGFLSDRVGRELSWTMCLLGFLMTYVLLIIISHWPDVWLMYAMVCCQGLLGYGLASVFGSVPIELFGGKRYGAIFGLIGAFSGLGAALGPWITGWLFDQTEDYILAFIVAMIVCLVSIIAMWLAGPRKVIIVPGRVQKIENNF